MSQPAAVAAHKPGVAHEAHHETLGFWRKYVFSTDHKVIGIQYAITALLFLLCGFSLMMLMRWQLAYPGAALPLLGSLLGEARMPGGTMLPDFYNELGAMHGTIMVFLGVVPLAVGGFGNFVVPLQIGAPDMAFPRLNMASYWFLFLGGVTMLASFFVPGGAAQSGWTSYTPLAILAPGPDRVAHRDDFPDHLVAARSDQLHHDHHPAPRQGPHVHAVPLLRVGAARDGVPAAPGLPAAGGCGGHAADGSPGRHELLPPERPRRQRPGPQRGRRRQPDPLAAPVLVPGAPGSLRPDPSSDGNRGRDHREQHAEAAVGLPVDGLLDHLPRLHVVHRVGAPHVHDRHGDDDGGVLPDDHDDHLDPVGRDPHGPDHLALGRIDTLQHAHAVRGRLPADVRHRRADGASARLQHRGHPAARYVLRHRALPLRRRAGDDLRPLRGDLLLVSEGHRKEDERDARQDPFRWARSSA